MFLVDTDDFDMFAYPLWREIDPSAVTAQFDFFFDHFFPINLKFGLVPGVAGAICSRGCHSGLFFSSNHDPDCLCGKGSLTLNRNEASCRSGKRISSGRIA